MPSVLQRRSYGSVKVFWLDREKLLSLIREGAERLMKEREEVEEIYLFGSVAEGRAVPGSDADLMIILQKSEKRFLDRPLDYLPYFEDLRVPIDIFCYTEEEATRVPLAREIREKGLLLAKRR